MTTYPTSTDGGVHRPRVLVVDDEPAVLAGLRRQLRGTFDVVTATDGVTGLELLARQGPFTAVLSDMRMPVMDGATFLSRARATARDATRILLTGQADIDTAIAAVNEGQIFRFLAKPCPIDTLLRCLHDAVDLHYRVQAERAVIDRSQSGTDPLGADSDTEQIREELPRALAEHQFVLWYQPVVDLRSGRTIGAEALIRWQHPDRGMVPPARFIPVAETSGHDIAIGRWALEQACHDAATWPANDPVVPLTVAVNTSANHIADPSLPDDVRRALARSDLPANRLVLEMTETVLLSDAERTSRTLQHLRDMGVAIAIDDFGTGYSSLSHLRNLPVDILKIDRSFVTPMPASTSVAVAEAIVRLGHALDLDIVAEGIETGVQWNNCRDLGCQRGQGFLFAKPMPTTSFLEFIRAQTG